MDEQMSLNKQLNEIQELIEVLKDVQLLNKVERLNELLTNVQNTLNAQGINGSNIQLHNNDSGHCYKCEQWTERLDQFVNEFNSYRVCKSCKEKLDYEQWRSDVDRSFKK